MSDLTPGFEGHFLLPANSTPLERADADVAANVLLNLDIPIHKLWDPFECPLPYLPYLAWALSVDVWDEAWPEVVKRGIVAASPAIHRRKGTRFAVEQALVSIGFEAQITEWWEATPNARRGTFSVLGLLNKQIYENGPLIDAQIQALVHEVIRASKPKSRVYDLSLGVNYRNEITMVAAGPPPLQVVRNTARAAIADPLMAGTPLMAGAMNDLNVTRTTAAASIPPPVLAARPGLAAASSSLHIIRLRMETSL